MASTTLVHAEELASHLGEWRVFDCRHDLAKPEWGEAQYRASHIPGALFAHLDRDLSAPKTGKNGRHPLPSPDAFAAWLGKQGLKAGDQVVCYDASTGATAARLWWMLRWVGHESAAVLDGGFAKWVKEGRAVTRELPAFASSEYPLRLRSEAALDVRTVQDGLKKLLLIDARAPVRYRGEQEPIDPVAGRIPGALNRFNMDNVNPDGTFKNSSQLKQQLEAVLKGRNPAESVHYCGSGVAACHNLLAMELAGLPGGKLYAGSWSEWSADPVRPREKS